MDNYLHFLGKRYYIKPGQHQALLNVLKKFDIYDRVYPSVTLKQKDLPESALKEWKNKTTITQGPDSING